MGYIGQKAGTLWWHTALHVIASLILLFPAVYLMGVLTAVYTLIDNFLTQLNLGDLYRGNSDDPENSFHPIMRVVQFGFAAYASMAIPRIFLKKSNSIVAASIFSIAYAFAMLMITRTIIMRVPESVNIVGWLDFAAATAAVVLGAFYSATNKTHNLTQSAVSTQTHDAPKNVAPELAANQSSKKRKRLPKNPPQ